MWTVVYMAQNKELVENVRLMLEKSGMLVKVKPSNRGADIAESDICYEILVPQSEVEEAHNLIIEIGF